MLALFALATAGCLGAQYDPTPPAQSPSVQQPVTATPPAPPAAPAPDMAGSDDAGHCGGMEFALQRIPPNVMLVLDRSGSMSDPIASGSATTKYDDLTGAITSLATSYGSEMRLGDTFFSADGNCAPGVPSKILDNNGATITSDVNNHSPGGNTPTATTLDAVIASKELGDATRANYVVLATDGLPNCSDTDVTTRINKLYSATPSVKTFVIGIGADTNTNPTLLNQWADAGHTARSGATHYYQTNSPADLKAAFDSIVGGIVSCDFKMSQSAPDPTLITVSENGTALNPDPANGYSYDASTNTITLHGTACDTLKGNAATKVSVVYGCPGPGPIQ
jgi:hypothetical protein